MWLIKIIAKLIIARLPVSHETWNRLGVFRHGFMDRGDYALEVFNSHATRAFPEGLPENFTLLELGPGDSLASMLIAAARGARKIWLVDHGKYANEDAGFYKNLAHDLRAKGVNVPDISGAQTLNDILKICGAAYLTGGLSDLQNIPSGSVDLIYSQAVLEHVRKDEFESIMRECKRVLKSSGKASHTVDFQDHLAHALNHLRFPERVWESRLFRESGFYTNRIRPKQMADLFRRSGFEVMDVFEKRWTAMPTPRARISRDFRDLPEDEFLVYGIDILLA